MKCYVCGNDIEPNLLLESKNSSSSLYRCPSCSVTFAHPQPDEKVLNEYYNGMYSELTNSFDTQKMRWAQKSMSRYLKEIGLGKSDNHNITFLDLGGGLGYYAKAAKLAGLKSILVERDDVSVTFAKEELLLDNILKYDLESFFTHNAGEKYDIVFFRHVIEHVTNPSHIIEKISDLIKDGGTLIIETDNNAGVEILFRPGTAKFYLELYNKLFKNVSFLTLLIKRPFAVEPPRHLFGFNMNNLSSLLRENKLFAYKKVHYRLGHPYYWPNLPLPSLSLFAKSIVRLQIIKAASILIDYGLYFPRIVLQYIGLSSGICIYARKSA